LSRRRCSTVQSASSSFLCLWVLKDSVVDLRTPTNKVCFLVAAGYFKARRRFFGRQFRQTDIEYAALHVGVNQADVRIEAFSKETCARHQRVILNHFGCSPFNKAAKIIAANEIAALIPVQYRPKLVLLENHPDPDTPENRDPQLQCAD
jgi:hypothetical protein